MPSGYWIQTHFNNSADENITTVLASQTQVLYIEASNINSHDVYIQFFDEANPVVGTTTPKQSFLVPQGNTEAHGAFDKDFVHGGVVVSGIRFGTACKYAVTKTSTGSTGPDSAITMNIGYWA